MPFLKSSNNGELMVDHRASPGLPPDVARRAGYDPAQVSEGTLFEAATLMCAHCQQIVIKNPLRDRERAYCVQCSGAYICDQCDARRREPDYVHMSFKQIVDLVGSGKVECASLGVRPLLIPTQGKEI
jgi:hypothetical protein